MSIDSKKQRFGTRAIHAGQEPEATTGAVMTPVFQTSTYAQKSPGVHQGFDYSRADNPTREAYEKLVASLENGKFGLAFASGMAAIDAVIHLLKAGDHVLCCDDLYGGTYRIFTKIYAQMGIETSFVDFGDLKKVEAHIRPNTKMLWFESPTNPLLKILDIRKLTDLAKSKNILSVVDNTFMSPYFQTPLDLGADIVMHSVTKYMNGHSDVIGGVLVTNSQKLFDELKFVQKSVGGVPGPWDAFLVMRGLKTLHVRMQAHAKNAMAIAQFLEMHKRVEHVVYPGLASHPQHELATEQMRGFGGMITFFIKGGEAEARSFLEKVKIFTLAESLGGVESLIEHPGIMTHASIPKELREKIGITDNLIRLSCGIEDVEDLLEDLDQALR